MLRSKELNKATVETNNNCKFCSLDVLAGLGVKNQIFGLLKYHVDLRTIYEHMSFKQLFTQPAKPTHRTARNDNGRGHTVRRSKYVPFSMVFFRTLSSVSVIVSDPGFQSINGRWRYREDDLNPVDRYL